MSRIIMTMFGRRIDAVTLSAAAAMICTWNCVLSASEAPVGVPDLHMKWAFEKWFPSAHPPYSNQLTKHPRMLRMHSVGSPQYLALLDAEAIYSIDVLDPRVLEYERFSMVVKRGYPVYVEDDDSAVALLNSSVAKIKIITLKDVLNVLEAFAMLAGYEIFESNVRYTNYEELHSSVLQIKKQGDEWKATCPFFVPNRIVLYMYEFVFNSSGVTVRRTTDKIKSIRVPIGGVIH